jgi:hypothetical protein
MSVVIKWSVILTVLVAIVSVIINVAGLHKSPVAGGLGFIVLALLINLGVIALALKETAARNAYGAQLMNGVLIGLVAGVLILLTSWLLTTVIFPDTLEEMKEGYIAFFESAGLPADQVATQIEALEQQTPFRQALNGLIGTFFTSAIGAAIIGIFLRRK